MLRPTLLTPPCYTCVCNKQEFCSSLLRCKKCHISLFPKLKINLLLILILLNHKNSISGLPPHPTLPWDDPTIVSSCNSKTLLLQLHEAVVPAALLGTGCLVTQGQPPPQQSSAPAAGGRRPHSHSKLQHGLTSPDWLLTKAETHPIVYTPPHIATPQT